MAILRFIAIGMIIVLAVPLILMSLPSSTTTASEEIMVTGNVPVAIVPEVTIQPKPVDPATWLANRPDLRDIYSTTTLNKQRVVVIEEIIEKEALFAAGETAPDEAFRDLFAAARAPARLISYCSDVIQIIGTKCDVVHSDVRENAQGKLEFTGHLAFVPAAALGDPSVVGDGSVIEATITLEHDGDLKPANEASTRIEAMQSAQSMCDALRANYGNCVLTKVAFDIEELWITDLEVLPAGTNPQRLETQATFQVYANRQALTPNQLMEQLRDMAGS